MDDVVGGAGGGDGRRDRSGMGLVKDKTGLGLSWGRAPRDGRGPKHLKSVWRDWTEAEEFRTRFEVLSAEEVERREIEKERASRCVIHPFSRIFFGALADSPRQAVTEGNIEVPELHAESAAVIFVLKHAGLYYWRCVSQLTVSYSLIILLVLDFANIHRVATTNILIPR